MHRLISALEILLALTLFIGEGAASAPIAQAWVATYNGPQSYEDSPSDMALAPDGSVVVTGYAYASYWRIWATVKFSPEGQQLWVANYQGSTTPNRNDEANALVIDADGNIYVTGYSAVTENDSNYADAVTIKYSPDGRQIWVARYGSAGRNNQGEGIALDSQGNVVVVGATWQDEFIDHFDTMVLKYNNNGQLLWERHFANPQALMGWNALFKVAIDADDNIAAVGYSEISNFFISAQALTIKYDSNGNLAWYRIESGITNTDIAKNLVVDPADNIYVLAQIGYPVTVQDITTIKYDPNGNKLWQNHYNGPDNFYDYPYGLARDLQGNIIVSGTEWNTGSTTSNVTLKYDANGGLVWQQLFNGNDSIAGGGYLAVDEIGGIYVSGYSGPEDDLLTFKYDAGGNLLWWQLFDYAGNYDIPKDIVVDRQHNTYVLGKDWVSMAHYYDYGLIKYTEPQLNLTLTPINPPIVIPANGGSFSYTATIGNTGSTLPFEVWIMMQFPDGSWQGPLLGPLTLTLPGGSSITRQRTQNVAASSPPGTYIYRGYLGDYPAARWDSSSFTFTKLGSGVWGLGSDEWTCAGEPFPGEEIPPLLRGDRGDLSASPNPFNPTTAISYQLLTLSQVSLQVYDVSGKLVTTLVDEAQEAGAHQAIFDGSRLASGLYFVRLEVSGSGATPAMAVQKLMLVK